MYSGILSTTSNSPAPVTRAYVEGTTVAMIENGKFIVVVVALSPNTVVACHVHYSPSGPAGTGRRKKKTDWINVI